jgi:hypothetical protein
MRNHLGTSFTVWKRRQTWFWLVLNQHGNGGTIGTASTENEAVSDARCSIEDMAAQHRSPAASPGAASAQTMTWASPCSPLAWINWWMSVAYQVNGKLPTR